MDAVEALERVRRTCEEQRADMAEYLTLGGAQDFTAYSKAVGAIGALDLVLGRIEELGKELVEE